MLSDEKNRPLGGFTGSVLSCYRKYTTLANENQMLINFWLHLSLKLRLSYQC